MKAAEESRAEQLASELAAARVGTERTAAEQARRADLRLRSVEPLEGELRQVHAGA